MIRLGLRLTLNGGREAAFRLAVTAVAAALGVGMLLVTLAGINAIAAQGTRGAWLTSTGMHAVSAGAGHAGGGHGTAGGSAGRDPLVWLSRTTRFGSQVIYRVDVAATGPNPPVPPGIPRLPAPGQFYASPALSRLLRSTPAAELGDRFPGRQVGMIGSSALPSPDSLVIVIGHTPRRLARAPGAVTVTSIPAAGSAQAAGAGGGATLEVILAVAAVALLFPVLTFIATAARLAAARREQRVAAMRLSGATPRQVALISSVEASVAAVAGVAAGFGLFFLLRPVVAGIPFTGAPFFPGDLSLSLADILLVALGVPGLAVVVARVALRRAQVSPLGVSQRTTPPPPRAWRVIPLAAGIGELAYFAAAGHPRTTTGQVQAFFPGFLLLIAGLVIAGPWLAMACARVLARYARRPAALIAGRRMADNPRAAFRGVSGLILALFVASVSTGVITTLTARNGAPAGGTLTGTTLLDQFAGGPTAAGRPTLSAVAVPGAVLTRLRAAPGVRGVAVIHTDPGAADPGTGLVSCAQLAVLPALGRCPAGAQVAALTPSFSGGPHASMSGKTWPAAAAAPTQLRSLPARMIAVATNGSAAATERARTILDTAYPYQGSALTIGERNAEAHAQLTQWQHDADVLILASLAIAGCGLAVSVTAGLTDRKRPFSLLRLTGAPLRLLHHVITLESAAPLITAAAISAGAGLLSAGLFLESEFGVPLRSPGAMYYGSLLGGLVISLSVIAATLPLLSRITGPQTARRE